MLEGIATHANGAEVYDPGHGWYGACLSSFGILQNTRVQRLVGLPEVKRWEELADPRLAGWVGAGDPRLSGTMNTTVITCVGIVWTDRGTTPKVPIIRDSVSQ